MTISVGILGATGYTGGELTRILARHPRTRITHVTSERYAGKPLAAAFPHLRAAGPLVCQAMDAQAAARECEVIFCALPHLTTQDVIPALLAQGRRVIDLSADFRLHDPETFRAWYGEAHRAPELLDEAVYGLVERRREKIASARLIANPGCYPTSVILTLGPLLEEGAIDADSLIIDAKSGVSGAGRAAAQGSLMAELNEGFKPYKTTGHRHIAEMEQELSEFAGRSVRVRFTPHLLPQSRGILSTCYFRLPSDGSMAACREILGKRYADEPFVRLLEPGGIPATSDVRGSNACHIGLAHDERTGWGMAFAAIDNLVKGASGQAVQNLNVMMGWAETEGLDQLPLFP